MRGKNGYQGVLKVISELKATVPIFVMFTLSPYNDFTDLEHVASLCKEHHVFLRVGIYNNIPFFDTIEDAQKVRFGEAKNKNLLTLSTAKHLQNKKQNPFQDINDIQGLKDPENYQSAIPPAVREFPENYDYISLYQNWLTGQLRLSCNSIMDSLIVLPDGQVPICQNLNLKLGNIHEKKLDDIFNSKASVKIQKHYSKNCNQCWISYHRKYDIALYRNFEKFFGKNATTKLLGYYKWNADDKIMYNEAIQDVTK